MQRIAEAQVHDHYLEAWVGGHRFINISIDQPMDGLTFGFRDWRKIPAGAAKEVEGIFVGSQAVGLALRVRPLPRIEHWPNIIGPHGCSRVALHNGSDSGEFRLEATQDVRFPVSRVSSEHERVSLTDFLPEEVIQWLGHVKARQCFRAKFVGTCFRASTGYIHPEPEFLFHGG